MEPRTSVHFMVWASPSQRQRLPCHQCSMMSGVPSLSRSRRMISAGSGWPVFGFGDLSSDLRGELGSVSARQTCWGLLVGLVALEDLAARLGAAVDWQAVSREQAKTKAMRFMDSSF